MRRHIAQEIETRVHARNTLVELKGDLDLADRNHDHEHHAIRHQHAAIISETLARLRPREQDILVWSFLEEQPPEQVRRDMGQKYPDMNAGEPMTDGQFRNLKSQAKQKFAEIARKKIAARGLSRALLHAAELDAAEGDKARKPSHRHHRTPAVAGGADGAPRANGHDRALQDILAEALRQSEAKGR